MASLNPKSWFEARKHLSEQLRRRVWGYMGTPPKDFRSYEVAYNRSIRGQWLPSDKWTMLARIREAQVILMGDFHAFAQAQKTQLKVLEAMKPWRNFYLAMEAFDFGAQKWLDLFVEKKISANDLRKKSGWDRKWGFPWENYLPLLLWAQKNNYRILALRNSRSKTLRQTDRIAAEKIIKVLKSDLRAKVFVVFGEYHLGRGHLQRELKALSKAQGLNASVASVHLNPEPVYFRWVSHARKSHVDVLSSGKNRFAIVNAPPWVAWMSYLNYLETQVLHDEDLAEPDIESALRRNFEILARDLNLDLSWRDYEVLHLSTGRLQKIPRRLPEREEKWLRWHVRMVEDFVLPKHGLVHCSRWTVNHIAELSGRLIHAEMRPRSDFVEVDAKNFMALIWCEAIAFFLSKLINPQRQCSTLPDIRRQLTAVDARSKGYSALALALDQRMSELIWRSQGRWRKTRPLPRNREVLLQAAKILGPMTGERLYHAWRLRRLKSSELKEMLRVDVTRSDFLVTYRNWILQFGPELQLGKRKLERL